MLISQPNEPSIALDRKKEPHRMDDDTNNSEQHQSQQRQ